MTYLCDTNVWLALVLSGHPHHRACTEWFDSTPGSAEALLCRPVQVSLLRLLTTKAVLETVGGDPLTNDQVWDVMAAMLLDHRVLTAVDEPVGLDATWRRTAARKTASPKLWMDAYLAAWAACSGWTLVTTDRAFTQFDGLDVVVLLRR